MAMNVRKIVQKYLKENSFDGLYNDECACLAKDIAPCGESMDTCEPGHKGPCTCGEHDWHVGPRYRNIDPWPMYYRITALGRQEGKNVQAKRMNWRVQIIGPITDKYDYNKVAFAEAATTLRDMGYNVWNPTEWDGLSESFIQNATLDNWLDRSLMWLEAADVVVILPGWSESKGSLLEIERARELGLPMVDYNTGICSKR